MIGAATRRSPLDAAPEPQSIDAHGDDAQRLLSAVGVRGEKPAYVFGNSSGAIIGLELAARHPEQVRTLVAHEPPLFELLPDRDRLRVVVRSVEETLSRRAPRPPARPSRPGCR
jgi:pimeloyl-ACP methyl ester carboxylesterase